MSATESIIVGLATVAIVVGMVNLYRWSRRP